VLGFVGADTSNLLRSVSLQPPLFSNAEDRAAMADELSWIRISRPFKGLLFGTIEKHFL